MLQKHFISTHFHQLFMKYLFKRTFLQLNSVSETFIIILVWWTNLKTNYYKNLTFKSLMLFTPFNTIFWLKLLSMNNSKIVYRFHDINRIIHIYLLFPSLRPERVIQKWFFIKLITVHPITTTSIWSLHFWKYFFETYFVWIT